MSRGFAMRTHMMPGLPGVALRGSILDQVGHMISDDVRHGVFPRPARISLKSRETCRCHYHHPPSKDSLRNTAGNMKSLTSTEAHHK
jgi:hypothetical protein